MVDLGRCLVNVGESALPANLEGLLREKQGIWGPFGLKANPSRAIHLCYFKIGIKAYGSEGSCDLMRNTSFCLRVFSNQIAHSISGNLKKEREG